MNRLPNQVPKSLKNIDVKAILRKRGIYNKLQTNQQLKESARSIAEQLIKSKSRAEVSFETRDVKEQPMDKMAYAEKQIHIVDVIEQKFETKVEQFVKHVAKGFLSSFEAEITNKDFAKIVQKDYFTDNAEELMTRAQLDFTPLLDNVATLAGNEANKLIGISDPYILMDFKKQIKKNIEFFTKSMLDTERDQLAGIIANGLEGGKSVPEIRDMIVNDFEGSYSKMQAQRVTRTEVMRASNQAAVDAYTQSGVVAQKEWLGYNPCPECEAYDGEIIELDADFPDGDPPLHPNCRCVVLPVLKDSSTAEGVSDSDPFMEESYKRDKETLQMKIADLESQIDKRTKEFKSIKSERADDKVYIKALERYLDGQTEEAPEA